MAKKASKKNRKIAKQGSGSTKWVQYTLAALFALLLALLLLECAGLIDIFPKGKDTTSPPPANQTPNNVAVAKQEKAVSRVKKITSKSLQVPTEIYTMQARRAVPMNNEAIEFLKAKYNPNLIGVPRVGDPCRLALEHPIDEADLVKLMELLSADQEGQEVVFLRTYQPSSLMGFVAELGGEMINYCEKGQKSCEPLDVYVYT